MGLIDGLLSIIFNGLSQKSNEYSSGYDRGSDKASSMSDSELRREIQKARENGISGMSDAGKTKAMMDEYNNRKN
ncbi:MAG: hypothetical protein J6D19_02155 [Clostridia bacterium]|nr:hypothetical protein [Clostridia bacterium]